MESRVDTAIEHEVQWKLLNTEVGKSGSGSIRYAAAMYFYTHDLLSPELLEIYRACSKFDQEDPILIAEYENVEVALPVQASKKRIPS